MDNLSSYHGDANLKALIVSEMEYHKISDQFIKGSYGHNQYGIFKGCAVGCTIDSINKIYGEDYKTSSHDKFEEVLGIPTWLAYLQDKIFEGLPSKENSEFAVEFLRAIPVGVDLNSIKNKFCGYLMRENLKVINNLSDLTDGLRSQIIGVIEKVLNLCEGDESSAAALAELPAAAYLAVYLAAESATAAETAAAPYAAAYAVALAAAAYAAALAEASSPELPAASAAAYAAALAELPAAAYLAAESATAAYQKHAEELIRLLRNLDITTH